MLDAPVRGEVEERVLEQVALVQVAGVHDQFVALGLRLGDDPARGRDDRRAANQPVPVFDARLLYPGILKCRP